MTGPLIVTERLELWHPREADEAQMFALMQDARTWHFFGAPPSAADHATRFFRNAGSWWLKGYGSCMVRLRGEPAVIGNCGIFHSHRGLGADFDDKPEAGWILAADHAGKGLAHEAMQALLAWFDREHGPQEVVCMIHPGNAPSIALAGKLGFVPFRLTEFGGPDQPVRLFRRAPVSPI